MTDKKNPNSDLIDIVFEPLEGQHGQPGAAPGPTPEEQSQAEAMAAIEAGAAKFILALLKMGRALVAKHLPEIREEWTDPVLQSPAEAAVPLLKKYMSQIMNVIGSNAELAAFAMAMIPLGMGYLSAMDRAAAVSDVQSKPAPGGEGTEYD
jgi:hypothetical protein